MKYRQRQNNEGWTETSGQAFRLACCDCGLVHDVVLVKGRGKEIGIAARRNNRATAQRRRNNQRWRTPHDR